MVQHFHLCHSVQAASIRTMPINSPGQLVQLATGYAGLGYQPSAEWFEAHRAAWVSLTYAVQTAGTSPVLAEAEAAFAMPSSEPTVISPASPSVDSIGETAEAAGQRQDVSGWLADQDQPVQSRPVQESALPPGQAVALPASENLSSRTEAKTYKRHTLMNAQEHSQLQFAYALLHAAPPITAR